MKNDNYSGCRIEIIYPPSGKELFEQVRKRVEQEFDGIEVGGKATEKAGAVLMVSLVFVPKDHAINGPVSTDPDAPVVRPVVVGRLHSFASDAIDEVMETVVSED